MFAIELGIPCLMFGPGKLQYVAAGATAFLQLLILLTGNYTFSNWPTTELCLLLLPPRDQSVRPSNRYVSFGLIALFAVL